MHDTSKNYIPQTLMLYIKVYKTEKAWIWYRQYNKEMVYELYTMNMKHRKAVT